MSRISIVDLEVFYSVGVTDEERAEPQRLLLSVEIGADLAPAAASDEVGDTINYFEVAQMLLKFGEGRSWKLLEKLAANIADAILVTFHPKSVTVEIKKFVIPQARYVSVSLTKVRGKLRRSPPPGQVG